MATPRRTPPEPPARLWRNPEPKSRYDVVIVGAGGHGLATAYYLARDHGIRDIAVLERGWLAGGGTVRNTMIIRSDYLLDESTALYDHALGLWEQLPDELEYDFSFSQCGVLNLAHTEQEVRDSRRRAFANQLNGVDTEWLGPEEVAEFCPVLDTSGESRYPVLGATLQRRAGTVEHDHVAWALARKCDEMGVDLVQNCEVTGFRTEGDRVTGVRTGRGPISAGRVGLAAAGRTSPLTDTLGVRLPLQSHPLQALASELLEPVHPCAVMSNHVHVYCSQAHRGELVLGGGIDSYNGYAQRGSVHLVERQLAAAVELFPMFARAHVLRTWAGTVDVTPDASPIIGPTPYGNLFVNCGWGAGGFKATPGAGRVFAHTIATGEPHPLNAPYGLERFTTGALIDEHGATGVAN
ncbi:sarcosine oxidase subunit beta [Saccharopolyspora lacisalsi]|uniref:Sarcosine oxidase subunit beta n=1 Tax=Halosaccharopolyspora lacisalsi TaxID=1000566 RepID=A0A839DVA9_9PSEU|nr:sarcosine oxidase subunit beta family protein [Halosaccharopolyspora lacisalsi]MBA8825912.1 sarcosine oxidase subunit beta [Halosaccharopolyspora lacisalsi]